MGGSGMNKEEILQKSREENAAGFMDERERGLRLREDPGDQAGEQKAHPAQRAGD